MPEPASLTSLLMLPDDIMAETFRRACKCASRRSMSSPDGFRWLFGKGRRLPLGKDTDTAMREGVLKGMEYEISGYITTMKHKYPELLVFLTGGDDFSFDTNLKVSSLQTDF